MVQWNTRTLMGQRTERFELVLYDQASYPTSSGNGRILYQYDDVNFWFSDQTDNDYGTVGIESPDQQDGVQYVYWELYSDGAEDVTDGRAILFTDDLSLYTGTPIGSATPESFEFALVPGNSITDSLQISNTGDGPLVWQIELINNEITTAQRNQAVRERAQRMTSATDTAEQHFLQNERTAKNEMDDLNREEHTKDQLVEAEPQGPPVITSLGGPDAYGYEWVDSNEPDGPTFQWHEDYGTEITELGEIPMMEIPNL